MTRTFVMTLSSVVALLSASANAADIYRPDGGGGYKDEPYYAPVNTWTGFYFGANGGYAFSSGSTNLSYTDDTFTPPFAASDPDTGRTASKDGIFGGAQLGYNIQRDRFVYGIEADFQGGDISGKRTGLTATNGTPYTATSSTDWFGTVRGRIGYGFDRALIYVTGGFAYGDVENTFATTAGGGLGVPIGLKREETATGYVLGAGLEYKFTPNWSVKAEYQYIDLGSSRLNATINPTGVAGDTETFRTSEIDNNFHTVRIGLNYHLGRGYEPLK